LLVQQDTTTPTLTFVSPLPVTWIPRLWAWLHEVPTANFDDYSPTHLATFDAEMRERLKDERTWGVLADGVPVGVVGYRPITDRLGVFHGICFTRSACGTGIAAVAVRHVLAELFAAGADKVCAYFFADNTRVRRFFEKLGAVSEGRQVAQSVQHGRPIDLQLMAFFRKAG
jgi:RimJ/RimL family protein N-acetyltransferase